MKYSRFTAGVAGPLLLLLLLLSVAAPAASTTCSPYELVPCGPVMFGNAGGTPSGPCCAKLTEQRPCLCLYIRDVSLRRYNFVPNLHRMTAACGVPYPRC